MERGLRRGNVIHLQLQRRTGPEREPDFSSRPPSAEGALVVLPARLVSFDEALEELSRFFPDKISRMNLADLHFPPIVRFRILPDGVEFCDAFSRREKPFSPEESAGDARDWTRCWYLSLTREGDFLHVRFMDKGYLGRNYGPAESWIKTGKGGPGIGEVIDSVRESATDAVVVKSRF